MSLKVLTVVLLLSVSVSSCSYLPDVLPAKRPPIFIPKFTFHVNLTPSVVLQPFEYIGLTGAEKLLGHWRPENAVVLQRGHLPNAWSTTLKLPKNVTTLHYRYFVCTTDANGQVQSIRRLETHLQPRRVEVAYNKSGEVTDTFGDVGGNVSIGKGWLASGYLLQLKLLDNPLQFKESQGDRKLFLKLVPVDYDLTNTQDLLATLVPSGRVTAEVARLRYGDSEVRAQPEHGVQVDSGDGLVFHVTTNDLKSVAYALKVYYADADKPDVRHLLGYQHIFPSHIAGTQGKLELPIIAPVWLNAIGTVTIEYLLVKPLPFQNADLRVAFADYWQANWTRLDVGHRGLGKSLSLASNAPAVAENTVASMKQSALAGADMVEFDVQLTSDLVPIIAHDFAVYICLESKTPTSKSDLTQVLIKDLNYDQLRSLRTYRIVGQKIVEYPAHLMEEREDHRLFPTLADFFDKVDKTLGFDIEIKWPQRLVTGDFESTQTIDKNLFVDKILEVVLTKGCGRVSFITSFDADICTMFRAKQGLYPVMFLVPRLEFFPDPRTKSIRTALSHAQASDLLGVVPHTSAILADASQVQLARDLGKQMFVWGDDASTMMAVAYFKSTGVNGVIYDRVDLLIPEGKKESVFTNEPLDELFQLQCMNDTLSLSEPLVSENLF